MTSSCWETETMAKRNSPAMFSWHLSGRDEIHTSLGLYPEVQNGGSPKGNTLDPLQFLQKWETAVLLLKLLTPTDRSSHMTVFFSSIIRIRYTSIWLTISTTPTLYTARRDTFWFKLELTTKGKATLYLYCPKTSWPRAGSGCWLILKIGEICCSYHTNGVVLSRYQGSDFSILFSKMVGLWKLHRILSRPMRDLVPLNIYTSGFF